MSNDYSTDPPAATAASLIMLSDKLTDMCQKMDKLSDVPQQLDRLDMTIKQLSKDNQQTRNDLQQTQTNFQIELEKIRRDVGELKTSKTRIDTLGEWFKWGGIALLSGILGSWLTLSSDVRATQTKTNNNDQRIMSLEKQGDQTLRILDEIRNKLYERNYVRANNEINQ
ncbi:hypothetical protein ACDI99_05790 [Acinetobacter radioresistens]|jgi:peptidoglycan hydrolase CwlO-like protein|uniref:hypothetical protein n=1 Tax=Acinetobacter TaxID=469 RepID=UPI00044F1959|nr:hypothetical protein [Acinetobacter sp. 983759]EXE12711.1 modifier of rudimentary family protein [Acinetobacter sp. 983759]